MLRRSLISRSIAGLVLLAVLLSSCSSFDTLVSQGFGDPKPTLTPTLFPTATPAPTLSRPSTYIEAPALSVLVQSNTLPKVEMRLPQNPLVIQPISQLGTYGGTWHMVMRPFIDQEQFIRTVTYEPLVRWTVDWTGIMPNLAESYSVNEDATEYTFTLRRWTRWSDGLPFTTRDIRFWYEDVLLNQDLTPVIPAWLKSVGKVAEFEFIDDVTFKVRFSDPNSLFLENLASPEGLRVVAFQAHYAEQFHLKYADEERLQKIIQDGSYASWAEMFRDKLGVDPLDNGNYSDPDRPRLSAWVLTDPYLPGVKFVNWERNPYYWKVDSAGHQLPYLDSVRFDVVNNLDDIINKANQGEIDMQNLGALGIDTAVVFGDEENPYYDLYELREGHSNVMAIDLNLTHADPMLREIFQKKDFRVALSYAIDRQEIIDQVLGGNGKPWQNAPLEDSPFYDLQMGTQYTEYNVKLANEHLDRAGFDQDPLGQRLTPAGTPISFTVHVLENEPQQIAMINMVARYLDAVGIRIQPVVEPLPIYMATIHSNLHEAVVTRGGATFFYDVLLDPSAYLPVNDRAFWAMNWAGWYNDLPGYFRERPNNSTQAALSMYYRARTLKNPGAQMGKMKGALLNSRENFWNIGIAKGAQQIGIAKKNFRNVPQGIPSSWIYPNPAPANPEQFYFEK